MSYVYRYYDDSGLSVPNSTSAVCEPTVKWWAVGFYDPQGHWHAQSNHDTEESAIKQVHYLNGGTL